MTQRHLLLLAASALLTVNPGPLHANAANTSGRIHNAQAASCGKASDTALPGYLNPFSTDAPSEELFQRHDGLA
ncbi:hypothetical protein PF005_g31455, partial [Phytophthora fragariae]